MSATWLEYLKKAFIVVACIAIGFTAYTLFSGNSNGTGASDVTKQLNTILANQRELTIKLDGSAKTALEILRRTEAIEARAGRIEGLNQEALGRIASSDPLIEESRNLSLESERIIREILSRNEGKTKQP